MPPTDCVNSLLFILKERMGNQILPVHPYYCLIFRVISARRPPTQGLTQWRFYIGARGTKPPKSPKEKGLVPQIPKVVRAVSL